MKKELFPFLLLLILCVVLSSSAETPDQIAFSTCDLVGYSAGGFTCMLDGLVYYCDYTSGTYAPLCTHPECNHAVPDQKYMLEHYRNRMDIMDDRSVCYAARLWLVGGSTIPLLYDGIIYFVTTEQNYNTKSNRVSLWKSSIDGSTQTIPLPDKWFPWSDSPLCQEMIISDGVAFLNIYSTPNSFSDDADSNPLEKCFIIRVSLASGESELLYEATAQSGTLSLMGCIGENLYFSVEEANGFTEMDFSRDPSPEELHAWALEYESKLLHSIMAVNTATGELITLDDRLHNMKRKFGWEFETVKGHTLYASRPPQSPGETALMLKFELPENKLILEYEYPYYSGETLYYPYCVLTDDIVMDFCFEEGRFALHDLKTGEIRMLNIPGNCFQGNEEGADVYDPYVYHLQPDPIIMSHYWPDGRITMSYVYADDLLTGNPVIRDFE